MKGLLPLFLGIFGTFAFSWAGLTFIPNYQIGHLDPQTDEEGTDAYPVPKSGMAERGRKIYVANGCVYCHSQQVRADYAASDIERKWGERRSAPRDYIFDRPVLLGIARMGPDLANVGKRPPPVDENAPSGCAWCDCGTRSCRFASGGESSTCGAWHTTTSITFCCAGGSGITFVHRLQPRPRQRLRVPHPLPLRLRLRRKNCWPTMAVRSPTQLRGTIAIFTIRAASRPIQTCRRFVSFMRSAGSAAKQRPMRLISSVMIETNRRQAGKSCRPTMPGASSLT